MKGNIDPLMFGSPHLCTPLPPGIGDLCSQPGYQSGHWSLPVRDLRRHLGGDPRHGHRPARHLLHPSGGARVAAGEDEARIVGGTDLLGTGRPLCCESKQESVTLTFRPTAVDSHVWQNIHVLNSCDNLFFLSVVQSLRKVGQDSTVLLICITVFLSYLPEAGQYSSFFLYLRQVKLPSPCLLLQNRKATERTGLQRQTLFRHVESTCYHMCLSLLYSTNCWYQRNGVISFVSWINNKVKL